MKLLRSLCLLCGVLAAALPLHGQLLSYAIERPAVWTSSSVPVAGLAPRVEGQVFARHALAAAERDARPERRCDFWHSTGARFIIPAGLITYGIVAQGNPLLQEVNHGIDEYVREVFPGKARFDDYIQYAPLAAYMGLSIAEVDNRQHNLLDRTIIAATSYLIMGIVVNTIKATVPVLRPDGSAWNSFPSGHTAMAFTGAHLLFREYKDVSPWIGIAGYAVATTTGVMRMFNKRHWLSDVAAGAGIAIASVEAAYLLWPVFDRWIYGTRRSESRRRTSAMTFTPAIGVDYYGAGFVCVF